MYEIGPSSIFHGTYERHTFFSLGSIVASLYNRIDLSGKGRGRGEFDLTPVDDPAVILDLLVLCHFPMGPGAAARAAGVMM